jgi:hypothetical protein
VTRWGKIGFWLVALAPVAAVLLVPVLVVQDGALHVSSADALGQLASGRFDDVITGRPGVPPNIVAELLLWALIHLVGATWGLKILVAGILIGFALAARFLVASAGAAPEWAVLLLPFAWHRPLAWGFTDYSLGVVLLLVTVGVVLRRPERPPLLPLAALLTLSWLSHLVPAVATLGVAVAVVATAAVARHRDGPPGAWGAGLGRVALAAVPVVVLTVVFIALSPPGASHPQPESLIHRIVAVLGMTEGTVTTVQAEYDLYRVIALLLYATVAVLIVRRGRAVHAVDGLLVAAVLGALVAIVTPDGVGGGGYFLGMRLAMLPPLLVAAWVAGELGRSRSADAAPAGALSRPALALAALLGVLAVGLVALRFPVQRDLGRRVADLVKVAPCLPTRSTVLSLNLDDYHAKTVEMEPLSDPAGFVTDRRDGLDLDNEAGTVPYYFWRYRRDQDIARYAVASPPGESYERRIALGDAVRHGVRVDAVLVVGRPDADPTSLADAPTRAELADLAAGFVRVAVSPRRIGELWLRRGLAASC